MRWKFRKAVVTAMIAVGLAIPIQSAPFASPSYAQQPVTNTPPVLKLPTEEQRPEQFKPYKFQLDITDDSTPLKDLKVEAVCDVKVETSFDGTHWYLHVDTEKVTDLIRATITVTDAQGLSTTDQLKLWIKADKPYFHPTFDRYFRVNKKIEKILVHRIDGDDTDTVTVEGLPPGLTWDSQPDPKRPTMTYITGTPTKTGEYTVTERLFSNKGGTPVEIAKLDFKITILDEKAPRIAGDFTLPSMMKAKQGDIWLNKFRIQHKHGEFPYSTIKFEVDHPKLSAKRVHDNWEITVNTDEVVPPTRVKVTMVDPDGVKTDKWTVFEVVDKGAPVLNLPKETQYPKQGEPYKFKLDVKDDKTPLKDLKFKVESVHKAAAEFDGKDWYLTVDTTNYSDVEGVLITVTDTDGLSTTDRMSVWIKAAKVYMHPTVDRTFRVGKEIEPILVRPLDGVETDYVQIEGLPPGLTYDPKDRPHRDKLRSYIKGTPTKAGVYPIVERVFNKDGVEQNKLEFKITVLEANAPVIHGNFSVPPLKANKGDIWRNRFDITHKHGEYPYSTLKFEVDNPIVSTRRSHDQWSITLNTDKATPPIPIKVTMVEPDGYKIDQWTTAEVVDPNVKTRKLVAPQGPFAGETTKAIAPITLKVDPPEAGDQVTAHGLPNGLTFDPATLTISGTPSTAGTFQAVVALKNAKGEPQDAVILNFTITGASVPPPGPTGPPSPPGQPSPTPTPIEPTSTIEGVRLSGETRVETAVAISKRRRSDASLDTAVLARADVFADAVASTPLAHKLGASLYLTQPDTLHPATAAELARVLKPNGKIVIMGREVAVSEAVVADLKQRFPNVTIERIGGPNRYGTAAEIYTNLGKPKTIALVDGDQSAVADALIAGTAMALVTEGNTAAPGAVLFTAQDKLANETEPLLKGDPMSVVYNYTGVKVSQPKVVAITGADPVERSIRTAEAVGMADHNDVTVMPSKATNVVDGMAGGVDSAARKALMFGAPTNGTDTRLADFFATKIKEKPIRNVTVYGGPEAITKESLEAIFPKGTKVKWEE